MNARFRKWFATLTLFLLAGAFLLIGAVLPLQGHAQSLSNPYQGRLPDTIPFLPAGTEGSLSQQAQDKINAFYQSKKDQDCFGISDALEFKDLYDTLNSADKKIIRDTVYEQTNQSIDLDNSLVTNAFQGLGFLLSGQTLEGDEAPKQENQQARNAGLFSGVSQACWENGSCTLCDGMIVFINVANGILALLAIVAVIFFVYGAGHLALSSGNENYVYKGKEAIKASVIGTIIVLGAWQIMAIVVMVIANGSGELVNRPDDTRVNWVKNWYTVAESCRNK